MWDGNWKVAIPLCGSFLWNGPLWPYGVKSGFAEKQFFRLRKLLLRTCLDCFQSTHYLCVDRIGNLKHCFPNNLMNTTLPRIFFFHPALVKLRQARLCKKKIRLFRMFLVKSANSTSLPRFRSLQIAQMHTIHN